jgi:hypothetical protein
MKGELERKFWTLPCKISVIKIIIITTTSVSRITIPIICLVFHCMRIYELSILMNMELCSKQNYKTC